MPEYNNWLLSEVSHVGTVTLNRPESRNSLDSETIEELGHICEYLRQRDDIWVIVLQGQGDHFSSGFVPELIRQSLERPEAEVRAMIAEHQRSLTLFEQLEKPTIARIQGFCIGGGLILALCCDFRVASHRTIFSLPEVRLGIPIAWGTQRITRVAGIGLAKRLVLLGERLKADEAYSLGLVHEIAPPEELDTRVENLVARLLKMPPRTVGITKRIINRTMTGGTEELELEAISELLSHPDTREAIDSYMEQRVPRFSG